MYAILCEIYNYTLMYANFYYILHNYQSPQYCLCALTLMIVYIYLRGTLFKHTKCILYYINNICFIINSKFIHFLGYLFKYLTYRLKNKQIMCLSIS